MAHIDAGKVKLKIYLFKNKNNDFRQQRQKEYYITLERVIRLEKYMKAQQQWTGWNRNKREVSQLHLQQQHVHGKIIELTLLTHQDMLILH